MGTVSIERLRDHVVQNYGPGTPKYIKCDSEGQSLADFAIYFLNKNVNPKDVMGPEAIQSFNKLFKFDFNNYTCNDSVDPKTLLESSQQSSPDTPPSNAICKFYSFGKNLSDNYQFANPADINSCSSDDVPGIHCTVFFEQRICKFFQPDHSLLMTHQFEKDDKVYNYTSYKTRTNMATVVVATYDNDNNLISELSYPISEIPLNFNDSIRSEVSRIVADIHSQSFVESIPLSSLLNNSNQKLVDPSKSYLLSLIS